jgi:hypothetical protein
MMRIHQIIFDIGYNDRLGNAALTAKTHVDAIYLFIYLFIYLLEDI